MPAPANTDGLNINPNVLDEDWFHLSQGGREVGIARTSLLRYARDGAMNLDKKRFFLEVALCARGQLATSREALQRFAKRRNE